jgi:tetratricopeptide (TPR) repeat protein
METIRQLVALGKQCFDNKQYEKAEHYLKKVLSLNDRYADVMNMLGVIHHIEGKFSSAIDLFKRALKINPRYTEAILNLAVLLNDLGQYQDAKKLYSQLRQVHKEPQRQIEPVLRGKLSNLHSDIGDIYRSIGLYHHAIEEYQKALNLNPSYRDIRTKLGQAYRENGQLVQSLKELKEVVKLDGRYSPARVQLGVTLYSQGKITDAKKEWKTVIEKDPDNEYAKMYLRLCEAQTIQEKRLEKSASKKKK